MGVPASVRSIYSATRTAVAQLDALVSPALSIYCARQGYGLTVRTKTLESFSEKLETGRYPKLSDFDDFLACTIVVPTATHEAGVIAFLDRICERVELKERNRTDKAPDVFRFDSTRYIARLKSQPGVTYSKNTDRILFEVQIRTVFEHAWSVVTHDLVYKSDDVDWQKLRLSAQLKAAVENIDLIIAAFETAAAAVPISSHPLTEARAAVVSRFKALIAQGFIPPEQAPSSWSRFSENVIALVQSYAKGIRAVPPAVGRLLDLADSKLRAGGSMPVPFSGSLFQLVLWLVSGPELADANLDNFTVVPSQELKDFYSLDPIPKPLIMDWDE